MSANSAADSGRGEYLEALTPLSGRRSGETGRKPGKTAALAGTAITGLAALLASTLTNQASEKSVRHPDSDGDDLDPISTKSLPTADDPSPAEMPVKDVFAEVEATETEEARQQLASLFETGGSDYADAPTDLKADLQPETTPGSDLAVQIVPSPGVSHPSQPIGPLGAFDFEQPTGPYPLVISGGITTNTIHRASTGTDADNDEVLTDQPIVLTGTDSTDMLEGGNGNDTLYGLDGKDFLTGGAGADTLDGGDGDGDVAEYVSSVTGVHVSLTDGRGYAGDAEGDTLVGIEFLHGSLHDDVLEGDAQTNRLEGRLGDDALFGMDGNDRLLGGYGADVLDGGAGVDIADYHWSDQGVTVDLSTGVGSGGEAEGDTLVDIENLSGSLFEDRLVGDEGTNRLWGLDGNDLLSGGGGNDRLDGGGGADHLDGGDGTDIADYSNAETGVFLSLVLGGQGGEATGDTYTSIENVYGSDFTDGIAGDDTVNRLVGNGGDDTLYGAGGNDYLLGGTGNDLLIGGEGADVFVFDGNFGDDTIADMWSGASRTDRIWLKGQDADDWSDLQSAMTQSGDDVVLDLSGGTITIEDTLIADLHVDDFILG